MTLAWVLSGGLKDDDVLEARKVSVLSLHSNLFVLFVVLDENDGGFAVVHDVRNLDWRTSRIDASWSTCRGHRRNIDNGPFLFSRTMMSTKPNGSDQQKKIAMESYGTRDRQDADGVTWLESQRDETLGRGHDLLRVLIPRDSRPVRIAAVLAVAVRVRLGALESLRGLEQAVRNRRHVSLSISLSPSTRYPNVDESLLLVVVVADERNRFYFSCCFLFYTCSILISRLIIGNYLYNSFFLLFVLMVNN